MRVTQLPDGRTLTVRPSTRDDAAGIRMLYEGLSSVDRYRRFFRVWHPDRQFFEKWATLAERGGVGLVAIVDDASELLVGEAGYSPLPDGDGDFALTVAAGWRGWLGHYLLDALCEEAAARGVPNLQADILTENRPMLALVRARGYAVLDYTDITTVRVVIGTATAMPVWPGEHDRSRVLVEIAGGRWHAERAVRGAGYQVVSCPEPLPGPRSHCPALVGRSCPLAGGADIIVFALRADDPRSGTVLRSHASLHAQVPVCAELSASDAEAVGLPPGTPRVQRGRPAEEILDVLHAAVGTFDPRSGRPARAPSPR